jgi:phosphate transport system substrate-binding protein
MIANQERSLEIIGKLADAPQTSSLTSSSAGLPVSTSAQAPSQNRAVSGRLRSIGSDTMDNLMELWQTEFKKIVPTLSFYHQGRGSSTAIPALISSQADLGPMSRTLKSTEIDLFKNKFGYAPVQSRVAVDAVAVYVHPSNPFAKKGLTLAQLKTIFGEGTSRAKTWGDLGLTGEWAKAPIHIFGRNSASGTHAFFKETVLGKEGQYTSECKALAGSEQLVNAIASDRFGIGYSGIGYLNNTVATVPLAKTSGAEMFTPEMQYAYSGDYPLARFLYLAVNRKPGTLLPETPRAFLTYIFSNEGQKQVIKDGFFPVSSKIAAEEKKKLGL